MIVTQIKMDITDLCFEYITTKDELEFHKALFGSFVVIMIKSNDYRNGYINATKLCADGGKRFDNWSRLDRSKELITYFTSDLTPPDVRNYNIMYLVTKAGNNINNLISGTYVYKKIILDIALWISKEYYNKIYDIIETYNIEYFNRELRDDKQKLESKIKEYDSVVADKNNVITSLESTIKELDSNNKELDNTNKQLSESVNKLNSTIERVKPRIITDPLTTDLYNLLVVNRLNNSNMYYISRIQERNYIRSMKILKSKYNDIEEVYCQDKVPNSMYILNRLKIDLKDNIDIDGNVVTLKNNYTEADLLLKIDELYNTKPEVS